VVIQLPAKEVEPGVEQRATDALWRYCRVKVADVRGDLHEVTRHGIRALLVGLVAVLILTALARSLETRGGGLIELAAEGLQVTSWVILWVPISLLVYDRSYHTRDRKIYERMQELEITVVPRT
jgi:hypothetical protein